jgi:N-sulfoglucosamine sulfohydrolase
MDHLLIFNAKTQSKQRRKARGFLCVFAPLRAFALKGFDMRHFLRSLVFGVCLGWAVWQLPSLAADRPNILWLIAEDFSPDLGCYGTKEVSTPNLDGLAEQGVRYTRFFTTAPVCSASRSAFMTGMYQTTIGAHNHRSHRDDGYRLPEGVRVLTDWLRDAGYFTANLRELPPHFGFSGTGKTDWNFTYDGKPFDSDRWDDLKTHQPFYAQINFQETHRAYHAPKHADPAKVVIPPYYPDHPVTRDDWAKYLDAATELDRKIGLILKQLETDGLTDGTIIVFFGDHGQSHVRAKQFCYDSGLRVPLIIRWPSKFPSPKHISPGLVDDRLLMSIDLAPTMLDIAGAAKPPKMQGDIFLGDRAAPPRKYVFGARDRCDETVFRFRTVRTDRYRYIHNFTPERPFLQTNDYKERSYPVWNLLKQLDADGKLTPLQKFLTAPTMPEEELYDELADPYETINLARSPDYEKVLIELRTAVDRWIDESNDQGKQLEPPELAAAKGATKAGSDPNGGVGKKAKKQKAAKEAK